MELYKAFWSELGEDLLSVLNESVLETTLSCRRAVITLLLKKGDVQEMKNWRPVSLLCTDYKIWSKALANRLKYVKSMRTRVTVCLAGLCLTMCH